MKIRIAEIKGLDRRVRRQMSPEKLEELSDSIKELGQIVPVKVRQNGDGYVLVYGHRRLMAAKAAGFTEIDAVVEDIDDEKLLTVALAENVIREDMAAIDIAKALQTIIDETGATQEALGRRLGWTREKVNHYLMLLEPEIKAIAERSPVITPRGVNEAKAGTGGDTKLAAKVLKKAADEELSTRQTRRVAEVVRQASEFGGDKAVARVLRQPAARILETAPEPKPKPKRPRLEAKPFLFEWIKDPQVLLAEDGINAARTVVGMIARGDRDPSGGAVALRKMRGLVELLLKEIDAALDRLA